MAQRSGIEGVGGSLRPFGGVDSGRVWRSGSTTGRWRQARSLLPALVCLVVLAGFGILAWPPSPSFTVENRQEEQFTELYFDDAQALTKTYVVGKPQAVAFSVHNLEGRNVRYTYLVLVDGGLVASGTTPNVPDSGFYHVQRLYTIRAARARVKIEIRLLTVGQSIHYWLSPAR